MGASASDIRVVEEGQNLAADPVRNQLERAARRLPESDLKAAILATLAERMPTVGETLAWIAILQAQRRRPE